MKTPSGNRPNRDSVTTIRDDGSRFFLHPADSRGFWTGARRISAWFLIAIYLGLPWVPVGGYPAVFLDITERRFHLFGYTLAFQDVWLLFFGITGLGFSLFLITSLLGRVWCGWACPQTVFLDHVFRRVERWIEGDALARRQLDAAPWTGVKVIKRTFKQMVFVLLAAVITHLFLAYFVSIPQLWLMMHEAPAVHWGAFLFIAFATAIVYFNFAWFREQLCLVICPYGRLQSVLLDDHSLVIGYDAKRGEPRGKAGAPDAGACVDCNRCVQVCPTGIDIRQGLQIECIACAACIDACDDVMDKLKRPRGLVRYDSTSGFGGGRTRWLRPRIWLYLVFLSAGCAAALYALSTVRPASLGVTRLQGAPYFLDAQSVRNQFLVRVVNKRDTPVAFTVTAFVADEKSRSHEYGEQPSEPRRSERFVVTGFDAPLVVGALGEEVRPLIVQVPRANYEGGFKFLIRLQPADGAFELVREIEFSGPDQKLLKEDKR